MPLPRVLIADDHTLFAEGLSQLLKERCDVVGVVGDGRLVLEATQRLRPDVVLLDVSMPAVGGLTALKQLKASRIECKAIVLTMHGEARLAVEALEAGADGFLLKESSGEELLVAIDAVMQGRTYLTSSLTKEVFSLMTGPRGPDSVRLTPRQLDVLRLVVQGKRVKEVATLMDLSPRSVEAIKYQIMQELNVHSTAELVRYAIEHGLVGT